MSHTISSPTSNTRSPTMKIHPSVVTAADGIEAGTRVKTGAAERGDGSEARACAVRRLGWRAKTERAKDQGATRATRTRATEDAGMGRLQP